MRDVARGGGPDSPRRVSSDGERARRVLDLVPDVPTATWGRDEQQTGEMWNSNSLIAWLLARSGHDTDSIALARSSSWAGAGPGVVPGGRR